MVAAISRIGPLPGYSNPTDGVTDVNLGEDAFEISTISTSDLS